jgi:hypothetical protein
VPVERDSIKAMGVSGNDTGPVHFYVYRGLGFDVFEPQPADTLPRPDPHVDEMRKVQAERQRQVQAAKRQAKRIREAEQREREARHRQLTRELELRHAEAVLAAAKADTPEPKPERVKARKKKRKADTPKPKVRVRGQRPSKPHPAKGWTPPTGGDLEAWLDQLD